MAKYFIVCRYLIFLTHSPVGGHLGGFHALGIVNRAAVNIGECMYLLNHHFVLGRMVVLVLDF